MRFIPLAALVIGSAFLAAHHAAASGGGAPPGLALFTFAVSAFRERLR